MNVWLVFAQGLFVGIPFGVIFNIPKWGRAILLIAACAVGAWCLLDSTVVIQSFARPWYINASELLGIIIGQQMGAFALNRTLDEWGIKH